MKTLIKMLIALAMRLSLERSLVWGRRLGWGRGQVLGACHGALERLTLAHPYLFDHILHRLGAWDPRLVAELVRRYRDHRPAADPLVKRRPELAERRGWPASSTGGCRGSRC